MGEQTFEFDRALLDGLIKRDSAAGSATGEAEARLKELMLRDRGDSPPPVPAPAPASFPEGADFDAPLETPVELRSAFNAITNPFLEEQGGLEVEGEGFDPTSVQQVVDRNMARIVGMYGPKAIAANRAAPTQMVGGEDAITSAARGINPYKPVEKGHMLASFAYDKSAELEAYQLKNPNLAFRIDPENDEIQYLDSFEMRWTTANPNSTALSQAGRWVGPASVLAPEAFAGITSMLLLKSPVGASMHAGMAAGLSEYLRLEAGKLAGINTKMTEGQQAKAALLMAGLSAGTGILGDKMIRVAKWMADTMSGKALNARAVDDLFEDNVEEALKLSEELGARFKGTNLRFNLAQASDSEDLKIMAAWLEGTAVHRAQFIEFKGEQRQALNDMMNLLNRPFESDLTTAQAEAQVNAVVRQMLDEKQMPFEQAALDQAAEIDNMMMQGITIKFKEGTEPVRRLADIKFAAVDRWARLVREKLERLTNEKEFIRNSVKEGESTDDLYTFIKGLKKEETDALIPAQKSEFKNVVPQRGAARQLDETASPELLGQEARGELDDDALEQMMPKLLDPNAEFTYKEMHNLASFLKRKARDADKGGLTDVDSALFKRFAAKVDDAIERDLGAIGDPDAPGRTLSTLYHRFKQKYAERMDLLNRGIIGDIIEKDGTRYKVSNEQGFLDMVSSDENMHQVMQLIGRSPNTRRQFQEAYHDLYRRRVGLSEGGEINMQQHAEFMEQHGDRIVELFGREQSDFIRTVGGMGKALEGLKNQRDDIIKEINAGFDAKFRDLNGGRLVSYVWNKDPERSRAMVEILKKNPEGRRALQGMQNEVLKNIDAQINRYVPGGGGAKEFKHTSLDKLLFGSGTRDDTGMIQVIRNVMGDQYAKDITDLNRAIQIASRETGAKNFSNTAFWTDTVKGLARAYVGLFTRPGRIITAADRIRARMASDTLAKAIMSPKDLRTLLSLRGISTRTSKAAHFLGSMGAGAWHAFDDDDDQRRQK
jgi:hypothetical protein